MTATPHPYAHILRAIADGQNVQWQNSSGAWLKQNPMVTLREIAEDTYSPARYRVHEHVPTITINGREVPEPLREMPADGTTVYWPILAASVDDQRTGWVNVDAHLALLPKLLSQGLLHATREAAIAHAEALISITAAKP